MSEVELHTQFLEVATVNLSNTRSEWAKHVKCVHNGIPGSACHICITKRIGILETEEAMREARRLIKKLQLPQPTTIR